MPCPYPLQIQLIDAAIVLFGRAFPLAAMKHRAQVTAHFIECLRQAKKDRALFLQINILGAYATALKSLSIAKGTQGVELFLRNFNYRTVFYRKFLKLSDFDSKKVNLKFF